VSGRFALRDRGAGKAESSRQFIQGKIHLFAQGFKFTESETGWSNRALFLRGRVPGGRFRLLRRHRPLGDGFAASS
jgi:hypothetical protein